MEGEMGMFDEVGWECVEDGGQKRERYEERIGLFGGGCGNLYWEGGRMVMRRNQ